jgi:hypothetical protein
MDLSLPVPSPVLSLTKGSQRCVKIHHCRGDWPAAPTTRDSISHPDPYDNPPTAISEHEKKAQDAAHDKPKD